MSKRKQSTPRPPRTRNRFRERELARALRAAKSAGVGDRVEIDPATGKISIVIAKPGGEPGSTTNPWDEVLTDAPNEKRPA